MAGRSSNRTDLAWVVGARGFLGRHVARRLARDGWRVAGIGHGAWDEEEAGAWGLESWLEAEVEREALEELARSAGQPALVFHAAGSASVGFSLDHPFEDFGRTVATTAAVVECVRCFAPKALLIYPSSAAVYGASATQPVGEEGALDPISPYGVHKVMAENLCRAGARHFGLRCTVIRFFSVYGAGLRKQVLWDLCKKLVTGPREVRLFGSGEETRDFLHVEDAAGLVALLAAGRREPPEVLNGASGHAVTVRELAEAVAEIFSSGTAIRFGGERRPGDPPHFRADVSRLARLGFTPQRTLRDGLREYVHWARQVLAA